MSRLHFLVPCDPRRRSWGSGSQTAAGERADIKQSFNDDDDDDDGNCGDDDDDNADDDDGGDG